FNIAYAAIEALKKLTVYSAASSFSASAISNAYFVSEIFFGLALSLGEISLPFFYHLTIFGGTFTSMLSCVSSPSETV
uniref:NADH dehydrogenase subunit 2 n=1 Tax=Parascaris univalens TaxID=6257 RepID=A0A915CBU1_PARUN